MVPFFPMHLLILTCKSDEDGRERSVGSLHLGCASRHWEELFWSMLSAVLSIFVHTFYFSEVFSFLRSSVFGVSFTCMCDGRGGTGWALLLGHRCSIQVRSSENSEWTGGGVRVWATCPWARPVDGKGWPRRKGRESVGSCHQRPVSRGCVADSCRLRSVSRRVHAGAWDAATWLSCYCQHCLVWWHWYGFGWSLCMEGAVVVAGGWELVQSKGWSLRAWSLAGPSQGNWTPAKLSGSQWGSGSSSTLEWAHQQSGGILDRPIVGVEAGAGRTGGV